MKNKGFNVIELIVVIVIIGILTMIAIPAFRGIFTESRLEEAGSEVVAFYQRVNRYATTEGVNYILQVKSNAGVDSLKCMREGFPGVVRDGVELDSRLNITSATATFTVQDDGFVRDNGNPREFKVDDSETGKTLVFYISPLGVMEVDRQ